MLAAHVLSSTPSTVYVGQHFSPSGIIECTILRSKKKDEEFGNKCDEEKKRSDPVPADDCFMWDGRKVCILGMFILFVYGIITEVA